MTRKGFYGVLITILGIIVLAGGGFAQGKHGDKHGGDHGDHGNGGGQEKHRGGEDSDKHGDRGNGNGNGQGHFKRGDDQRIYQQQQQWQQQRQNEWNARRQQQEQTDRARQQQRQNELNARQQQQQQAWRQQPVYRQYQNEDRGDRGKHKGWNDDGPRGNAYGLRNIWPGQFRGWRDPANQDRRAARQYRSSNDYYYSDPLTSYYPVYRQPISGYNSYGRPSGSTRETIVRTIISSFFAPEPAYYNDNYYAPAYQSYSPGYYQSQYQQSYYGGYNTPYYSQASYSPAYGSPYYGQGYDPYGNAPLLGSQLFGGGGLKSTILNIGLQMLQGFLGQGYSQGLTQGQYARAVYGTRSNNYYDPYAAPEPAYYSPLASSFADQRQLLEEGYRLGYQDAMMNRDPYGARTGGGNVDLVSQFLANALGTI